MINNSWFVFEVNAACNADCPICFNPWKHPGAKSVRDMPLRQIDRLLTRLKKDAEPSGMTLSGGEPLLRPDLPEIIALCKRLGIPVCIETNGILLDKLLLEKLLEAGTNCFEVFLPATEPALYQKMTGRDQIRSVRKSLVALGAAHVPYTISTLITRERPETIKDILEMGTAFGASGITLNRCLSSGRALLERELFQPDTEAIKKALDAAEAASRETGLPVKCGFTLEPCLFPHSQWPGIKFQPCQCTNTRWTIGPDGTLRTCGPNTELLGNLLEEGFAVLATGQKASAFREKFRFSECNACEMRPMCGGGCRFSE